MKHKTTDEDFLTALYHDYKPLLYKKALEYANDRDIAEDIVQDTVIKLTDKIEKIRSLDRCALTTYVVYTIRSVAVNELRRRNIIAKHTVAEDDTYEEPIEPSAEDLFFRKYTGEMVRSALALLPKSDRELIEDKYYLDLEPGILAEKHGLSQSHVRMKLSRIRKKLGKLLKEMRVHYEQ